MLLTPAQTLTSTTTHALAAAVARLAALWHQGAPGSGRVARHGVMARALSMLGDIYALARHRESRAELAPPDADLVEARLMAEHWRTRAETAESRAKALETRLASAEMTALDLRSRVVCLHGKLATTTATVRYRSLTMALEDNDRLSIDSIAPRQV